MTTPLLGLSEIAEGVVNQATIHNTALRQIEARGIRVLSKTTTTPAVGAAESDSYIIPAGATGVWSGKTNQMACWIGGAWSYYTPLEGVTVWVNNLDTVYSFDGTTWVASGGSGSAETVTTIGALINGATAKTTPVDADYIGLMDSAASNVLKKLSWANIKATLKTYFDTLYAPIAQPFDVHAFYPGIPTASAKVVRVPIARAVTFAANFAGSYFAASANATGTTVFDVQKAGVSIGSISIAAGGTTATFTTTSGTSKSFAAGEVLMIVAPGSADATLADPGFVLVGAR
jgi:hypothetical protein